MVQAAVPGRRFGLRRRRARVGREIVEARAAVTGGAPPSPSSSAARLAAVPALEAAVNNAMLDLVSRAKKSSDLSISRRTDPLQSAPAGQLEGPVPRHPLPPLERAKRLGFQAFTMPALQRDAMIPLQEYVDRVRKQVGGHAGQGGRHRRMGARRRGRDDARRRRDGCDGSRAPHPIWFDEPTGVLTTDALAKIVDEA